MNYPSREMIFTDWPSGYRKELTYELMKGKVLVQSKLFRSFP